MEINFKEPDIILLSAFRYALGRSTYITKVVSDEIKRNWEYLSPNDQKQIKIEIECAGNLGMSVDMQYWNRILKLPVFPITKKLEEWPELVQKWACREGFKPEYVTAIGYDYIAQAKVIKFKVDVPKEYQHLFVDCSKAMFYCQINEDEL